MEPASVENMAFPLPDKPSFAILPFDNVSGNPELEYLSDGVTGDLTFELSKVPAVFVIAACKDTSSLVGTLNSRQD